MPCATALSACAPKAWSTACRWEFSPVGIRPITATSANEMIPSAMTTSIREKPAGPKNDRRSGGTPLSPEKAKRQDAASASAFGSASRPRNPNSVGEKFFMV